MFLERIVSEGLAHFSYLVGSGAKAFVVDPRRDCQVYADLAKREGMRITHIFETHRNEDYAIGSQDLVQLTGAKVLHGPGLDWEYGEELADGQRYRFGGLELEAVHTPGHTYESMSYVLRDTSAGSEPVLAFTGDTLFVGDVGRTDLPGPEHRRKLSELLYDSLHKRLLTLGDGCIIAPAHGAGSVCGGDIADRATSTIGLERTQNPLIRLSKEDFVERKMREILERPPYFSQMEIMNQRRHLPLSGLPVPQPLVPGEFAEAIGSGAVVVDTRLPHSYAGAHTKGSSSIWIDGLPAYAGWLLPYDRPLLLVVEDEQQVERVVRMLVRIGYDNVQGYLRGGMVQWYREGLPYESTKTMDVHELKALMSKEEVFVLDPRPHHEWAELHLEGAKHIFIGDLEKHLEEIPKDRPVASMCSVGFRGSMAAALLQERGYDNVAIVIGGVNAWKAAGYPVIEQ